MKTPREILLKRHAPVETKLDALRQKVLGEHAEVATASGSRESRPALNLSFVVRKLWQELIWPCRRIWLGMAAVWLVIAVLNLSPDKTFTLASAETAMPNRETLMALREQRRLLVQLLEPITPEIALPAVVPPPRSEQRPTILFA
ncbi:MAG: hypothetical protein JWR69_357 [Pedosphaera sp.]|nr:hypothetical protein [Pedosphaera sp.]